MRGVFMLGVSAVAREGAAIAGGGTIDVVLELDTAPREVTVPKDFKKMLDGDHDARRRFEGLSFSKKQRLVLPIDAAKAAETRQRRIEKAMAILREGHI